MNICRKLARQSVPILALMLVTGCETPPPLASAVQPWPVPPPPGYAMVMIYREGRPAVSPSIFVDDVKVLKLNYNSYTWVYVRKGQHAVQMKFPFFFHGLNIRAETKFEAGKNYYLKLAVWNGGGYPIMKIYSTLNQVPEQTATAEAKRCWFRKPSVLQIESLNKETEEISVKAQPNLR